MRRSAAVLALAGFLLSACGDDDPGGRGPGSLNVALDAVEHGLQHSVARTPDEDVSHGAAVAPVPCPFGDLRRLLERASVPVPSGTLAVAAEKGPGDDQDVYCAVVRRHAGVTAAAVTLVAIPRSASRFPGITDRDHRISSRSAFGGRIVLYGARRHSTGSCLAIWSPTGRELSLALRAENIRDLDPAACDSALDDLVPAMATRLAQLT